MGRVGEAIAAFRQAIELRPNHGEAYYALGNLLKDEGRHEEAIAAFTQRIRLKPEHAEPTTSSVSPCTRTAGSRKRYRRLHRTIQLRPDHAQAYSNLGVALQDSCRAQEAGRVPTSDPVQPRTREDPRQPGALLLDLGQVDEGTAILGRAIELQPNLAEAHYNLGIALYRENRLDEAIDAYRRRSSSMPDHAEAALRFRSRLAGDGQAREASQHFHQALLCGRTMSSRTRTC